jgi:hypothetical protein
MVESHALTQTALKSPEREAIVTALSEELRYRGGLRKFLEAAEQGGNQFRS